MKPGVSIIICCYNSAKRLPETLRHLALQEVPSGIPWEIIVVNNASTDDTVQIAEQEWAQYNLSIPFRIVEQPKPGLSNARDKGFEVAAYEYCLFCDDDNWLQSDYVRIAFETMESDPMIGAVGGEAVPIFEVEPEEWLEAAISSLAIGPQGEIDNNYPSSLYGAGVVIRKEVYFKIKDVHQFILNDRIGKKQTTGQDTELSYLIRIWGYKLMFNESCRLYHYLPKERLTYQYMKRLFWGFGEASPFLQIFRYYLSGKKVSNLTCYKDILYRTVILCKNIRIRERKKSILAFYLNASYIIVLANLNKRYKYIADEFYAKFSTLPKEVHIQARVNVLRSSKRSEAKWKSLD